MDTKWNNTHDDPGVDGLLNEVMATVEQVQAEYGDKDSPVSVVWAGPKPGPVVRAVAGFLAFFLSLSLMLSALGQVAARQVWEGDTDQWWKSDWQETEEFRWQISDYLEFFLTLGAEGALEWYADFREYGETGQLIISDNGWADSFPEAAAAPDTVAADARYQNDKNLLYCVAKDGKQLYSNAEGQSLTAYDHLPEGYNFLMRFADGKVTITKDGKELDVYGDGIYDGESDWGVPGYVNFPAGEELDGVSVLLAVRAQPIRYITGNYTNGYFNSSNRLFRLYQSLQDSRDFYKTQAVLFGVGVLLLAVYVALRRGKAEADRAIAKVTAHVWTEARVIAVLLCLVWLVCAGGYLSEYLAELQWITYWQEAVTYAVETSGLYSARLLGETLPLLALFWVVYLIINDHRHTPKGERKSLLGRLLSALKCREMKWPAQKRLARAAVSGFWNLVILLAALAPVTLIVLERASYGMYTSWYVYFVIITLLAVLLLVWQFLGAKRGIALSKDIGRLMDQVAAVHDGDLSTPLELPMDSDLRATAGQLNDIQAGMERALAEQTHSERMKVELISNVSHDLKTPLTSILTYADLLTQEEGLPDHVRDYARIIDQKARRLSAMVGDVFEVSKAAAGQLPVKLDRLDFAKLLRQTLADLDEPIRRSGLTFKVDLPEGTVPVVADGDRLYRVFQNLVQNALKYAMPGSRVYLTLTQGAGMAEASLRNTSRDELPAGVDFTARFTRGDESRSDGGSGLGLSIASSFTEACGGAFRVETVADLFTAIVTLPLAGEVEQ